MQTFLPHNDLAESASVLDNLRLGKQRVECLQILKALSFGPFQKRDGLKWVKCSVEQYQPFDHLCRKTPWYNHPATQMWKGYERFLQHHYYAHIVSEWIARGYADASYATSSQYVNLWNNLNAPWWLGYEPFHAAHRAILLAKNPKHYKQFGWTEQPAKQDSKGSYPYIWPTKLPVDVVEKLKQSAANWDSLYVFGAPNSPLRELKVI